MKYDIFPEFASNSKNATTEGGNTKLNNSNICYMQREDMIRSRLLSNATGYFACEISHVKLFNLELRIQLSVCMLMHLVGDQNMSNRFYNLQLGNIFCNFQFLKS